MKYIIDGEEYNVIIEKKNNKNLYIRVKEDLNIYVSANYFVTKKQILEILDKNKDYLKKMINKRKIEEEKNNHIYYLGECYDLVFSNLFREVEIDKNKIYTPNSKVFEKWYKKNINNIFTERLELMYNRFEEKIPFPKLRIRTMKTRWGVCNVKSGTVTLNSKLIEYNLDALDYVIVHELSHLIHFNHSKEFWKLVEKYIPNYKKIRKYLKES